jgi:hypothetical protein
MLGHFLKAVIETAKLPVDLAADVITLGGAMTDQDEPYTVQRVKRAYRNLDKAGRDD